MSYYFGKPLASTFDEALSALRASLEQEEFKIMSEIDIKDTLKKDLQLDVRNYRILGACCPSFAYLAINAEDTVGTLIPCNVVLKETSDGSVEVASIDPVVHMKVAKNPTLNKLSKKMREKLKRVIGRLV